MKIIAVTNQKGGVGKTTTCINLAAALGLKGKKVLLVDIDPQGNATTGSGLNKKTLSKSVYHSLIQSHKPSSTIISTSFHYDILPSNQDLAGIEVELASLSNREWLLKKTLSQVGTYDFILLDCPPSLSLMTINALCASDHVIIPMQCEFYALEGLSDLISTYKKVKELLHPRLSILGLLLTMFDHRNLLSIQVSEKLSNHFGSRLFSSFIPRNVRLAESPSHGKPSIFYDPKARGSLAYLNFADEFLLKLSQPL